MSAGCCEKRSDDRKLTWKISSFYQVNSYDAHQAGNANQAAQSEDAGQHELLACFKFQPPDHVQWHTEDDDIKSHIRGCDCPVIRLKVYALVREGVLGVPHSRKRAALENQAENRSYTPCDACRANDPCSLFEFLCVEDPAIHQQDGDFDHKDRESVSN